MSSMKICSFEGCGKVEHSSGFCNAHNKQRLRGEQLKQLRMQGDDVARFKSYLQSDGDCLVWTGVKRNGYGSIKIKRKIWSAHKYAYTLWVGEIPEGSVVHHKCAVKACCNPEHLQLTTHHDNMAEMFARKSYEARIAELEAEVAALKAKYERE